MDLFEVVTQPLPLVSIIKDHYPEIHRSLAVVYDVSYTKVLILCTLLKNIFQIKNKQIDYIYMGAGWTTSDTHLTTINYPPRLQRGSNLEARSQQTTFIILADGDKFTRTGDLTL